MENTAYVQWLNKCADKFDPPYRMETIAFMIYQDLANRSDKAFDLITSAGHTLVNLATLADTAKQVIDLKNTK